jgi:choline dehydrogenase-like flavoprotein
MTGVGEKEAADICVVGAGLVGGIIAYELARRGLKVVVLEAGPRYKLEERFAYMQGIVSGRISGWAFASDLPERDVYSNNGEVEYPVNHLRAKGVGGSTLHWGGQIWRFLASDFRLKSLYGIADDWPIGYDELEPYYAKAERALGVSGTVDNPFMSWRSSGYPMPAFPFSLADRIFEQGCKKIGVFVHTIPWARNSVPYQDRPACASFATCGRYRVCPIGAQYTSEAHLALAEKTGNARVVPHANVVRLLTDRRGHIDRAIYMGRDKKEGAQKASIFVLAAHTIETARLLLLSESSQFPHGLANGSGMVGKNFMERPAVAVTGIIKEHAYPHRIGFPTAASLQFCDPKNRGEIGAMKMAFHTLGAPLPHTIAGSSGKWGKGLADEVREMFGHQIEVEAAIEQLPDPKNTVTLDPNLRDFFGDPAPRITYSFGSYEKATIAAGAKLSREVLAAVGAQEAEHGEEHGFAGHPMGTCRMGNDLNTSVVDRNLRAHEVPNLFIVGGSVFVTGGSLQPSLTMAALAIRAAEHIAKQRSA